MNEGRIDYLLKIVGAFVAVSFAVSYAYQLAFLMRLDIFFSNVPISLADISKGALAAMPIVAVSGFGALAVTILLPWYDDKIAKRASIPVDSEQPAQISVKKVVAVYTISALWLIVSILIFIVYSSIAIPIYLTTQFLAGFLLGAFRRKHGTTKAIFYLTLPLLVLAAYFTGDNNASSLMLSRPDTAIIMTDGSIVQTALLTTYEAGVLTFDGDSARFTKWDSVKDIKYRKATLYPSVLCDWDKAIKELDIPTCRGR